MGTVISNTPLENIYTKGIEGTRKWGDPTITCHFVTNPTNIADIQSLFPLFDEPLTGTVIDITTISSFLRYQNSFTQSLNSIAAITNISFAFAPYEDATIRIAGVNNFNNSGVGVFPGDTPTGSGTYASALLLGTDKPPVNSATLVGAGHFRDYLVMHELLHTLGLGHPHENHNGTASWSLVAPTGAGDSRLDNVRFTVMSYESPLRSDVLITNVSNGVATEVTQFGYPVTPMAFDIAALQNMYGADYQTNTNNTNYYLTDPQTVALDLKAGGTDTRIAIGQALYCIWDAGDLLGRDDTDAIIYSGTKRCIINLNDATLAAYSPTSLDRGWVDALHLSPIYQQLSQSLKDVLSEETIAGGMFSRLVYDNVAPVEGGFSIANGVIIENATGGSGSDIIVGNEFDNRLVGNAGGDLIIGSFGNDSLYGGYGNDWLDGGSGTDYIHGGGDTDTVSYAASTGAVTVAMGIATSQDTIGSGFDTLISIENLLGSGFDDTLTGNNAANKIDGGGGNDTINGGRGADTILGGSGSDFLRGGRNASTATTSSNIRDMIDGGSEDDRLIGESTANGLLGGLGNDTIYCSNYVDPFRLTHNQVHGDDGDDILIARYTPLLDDVAGQGPGEIINSFVPGEGRDFVLCQNGQWDNVVYFYWEESLAGSRRDVVKGFRSGEDTIDLTLFSVYPPEDPRTGSYTFLQGANAAFTGTAPPNNAEFRYRAAGGNTYLEADINGDRVADFQVFIYGILQQSDFI